MRCWPTPGGAPPTSRLTHNGELNPELLWTPPFTEDAPGGPNAVFDDPRHLVEAVRQLSWNLEPLRAG